MVLEDGAARALTSFRLVEGPPSAAQLETTPARRRPARSAAARHARHAGLRSAVAECPPAGAAGRARLLVARDAAGPVGGGVHARRSADAAPGLHPRPRRAHARDRSRHADGRARRGGAPARREPRAKRAGQRRATPAPPSRPRSAPAARPATSARQSAAAAMAEVTRRVQSFTESAEMQQRGQSTLLSAHVAGQGRGRARRTEGDPALLRGLSGSGEPRGGVPHHHQRSQPRQRQLLRGRCARPRHQPRSGRRWRRARQSRADQPAGAGQARLRPGDDRRGDERRDRAVGLHVQHPGGARGSRRKHRRLPDRQFQRSAQGTREGVGRSRELLRSRLRAAGGERSTGASARSK